MFGWLYRTSQPTGWLARAFEFYAMFEFYALLALLIGWVVGMVWLTPWLISL